MTTLQANIKRELIAALVQANKGTTFAVSKAVAMGALAAHHNNKGAQTMDIETTTLDDIITAIENEEIT